MEGARGRGANGVEQGNSGVRVGLVLLAGGTTFDVLVDVRGQAGPPKLCSNKLVSFQISRVTRCFMIMATLENSVAKGFIIGDIDAPLVGEDACFDLPVKEAGTERERNILVHRLEGLEDNRIVNGG